MSTSSTPCPNTLQWAVVSTTERPVTQVAEVAVNRASSGLVKVPEAAEKGIVSSAVPKRMTSTKLPTISRTGGVTFRCLLALAGFGMKSPPVLKNK